MPAKTHGMTRLNGKRTKLFQTWLDIRKRCGLSNTRTFKHYGGRGITMYSKWQEDFKAFASYIGQPPTIAHRIERVDNNKGYRPGNVVWATQVEQCRNMRKTIRVTIDGKTKPAIEWCEHFGVNINTFYSRYKRGWNLVRAIKP